MIKESYYYYTPGYNIKNDIYKLCIQIFNIITLQQMTRRVNAQAACDFFMSSWALWSESNTTSTWLSMHLTRTPLAQTTALGSITKSEKQFSIIGITRGTQAVDRHIPLSYLFVSHLLMNSSQSRFVTMPVTY